MIPYGICLSLSELFYLIVYLPCCCKCQYSILFLGHLLSMPFSQWHCHSTHDTAPQPRFQFCTHTEKHQVLFLFSHGKYIFEAESRTSSPRPPPPLLYGKLDLLVPSPTPQDPSPSLFTHLRLHCLLCPPLSQNSETNTISHHVDCIFIMNVCSWYNSQRVYCWPVLSGKSPEDF